MINRIIRFLIEKLGDYYKIVFIGLGVLITISLSRNILRIQKAQGEVRKAQEKVDKLAKEKEELEERLKEIRSDEFIEKQLRNNLNLAKEGEIVVVLPEDEVLKKLAPKYETEEEALPDPNWKKWLNLFL